MGSTVELSKIVDKTKVYGGGRTSIPVEIRRNLGIKDGDEIIWVKNDHYYIMKVDRSDRHR